jgi:RimJ/RimL family protein N-acetyltransferase
LFSYLKKNVCIGYGGLVHINWHDNIAEISFIMDTVLEKENFELNWTIFLTLIEEVAFQHLYFHKLFTYAFNLRPHLYEILVKNQFEKEAILKEHAKFDNKYIDVVIHSKINGIDKI